MRITYIYRELSKIKRQKYGHHGFCINMAKIDKRKEWGKNRHKEEGEAYTEDRRRKRGRGESKG